MILNNIQPETHDSGVRLQQRTHGLYIHVPFCKRKCLYCDFISHAGIEASKERQRQYTDALLSELKEEALRLPRDAVIDTIYVGGGTPTVLDGGLLREVMACVHSAFRIDTSDRFESSIEANPESVDLSVCRCLKECGFTRVSLGVQSLQDEDLAALGRCHDANTARRSFAMLSELVSENIGVDLMFGIPGQTLSAWKKTLSEVLLWRPAHVSFYGLQIEEGTPYYHSYRTGALDVPAFEIERAMYDLALSMLDAAGYEQYEISSACLPGYRCLHNMKYWSMQEYLGAGLSAHSYLGGVRKENTSDWHLYTSGRRTHAVQQIGREECMGDYIFTALRLTQGFLLSDFYTRFHVDFEQVYGAVSGELKRLGWLEVDDRSVRLSRAGMDRTNIVIGRLLNEKGENHAQ